MQRVVRRAAWRGSAPAPVRVFTDASLARPRPLRKTASPRDCGIGLGVFAVDAAAALEVRVFARCLHPPAMDVNYGELLALLLGTMLPDLAAPMVLHTDSATALSIALGRHPSLPLKYRALADDVARVLDARTGATSLVKVKAHSGVYGNDQADALARRGAVDLLAPMRPAATACGTLGSLQGVLLNDSDAPSCNFGAFRRRPRKPTRM